MEPEMNDVSKPASMAAVSSASALPPAQLEQVIGVQYMRAVAAISVVAHHILEIHDDHQGGIPDFAILGTAVGVDIFFVISGFIMMAASFSGPTVRTSASTFLLRRAVRIYPLYLVLAGLVLVLGAVGIGNKALSLDMMLRSFLLLPSHGDLHVYSWTLKYEMYFYAMFALCLLARSRAVALIGTVGLLAFGYAASGLAADTALQQFLANPIAFEFGLGLLLGYLYTKGSALFAARGLLTVAAIVAVVVITAASIYLPAASTYALTHDVRFLLWGVPSLAIVAWSVSLPAVRGRIGAALLMLGNASYALYLTHYFVMEAYRQASDRAPIMQDAPLLLMAPVLFAVCAFGAVLTHLWIERPLGSLVSRWTRPLESASSRAMRTLRSVKAV